VPWFDNAGMNRTDGNLVQVFRLDRQEWIRSEIGAMNKPGARIRQSDRLLPVKVAHGTLQPDGRPMHATDGWETPICAGQARS
jgi:hypothetical protein